MKKHILCFFLAFWALGIYSCSEPGLTDGSSSDASEDKIDNAIYFSPEHLTANSNSSSTFTIDIHVQEVASLIGAEIEFSYDKSLVDFTSASIGALLAGAPENVLIDEIDLELGRVLLTLATAQDGGFGISGTGALVRLTFTPKSINEVFILNLDLSLETAICPWHGHSDDHSVYIENLDSNVSIPFPSLGYATVYLQE